MANKMTVTQPQPVMEVRSSQEWSTGICCFAFWCCPCFACQTSKRFGEPLCAPLLDICGYVVPPISMSMRTAMRYRYGIKGTIPLDCVCATFCTVCIWCQMSREMEKRNIPIVLVNAKNT